MTTSTVSLTYGSQRLADLIAAIDAGALDREKTGQRLFAAINLVREAGLGPAGAARGRWWWGEPARAVRDGHYPGRGRRQRRAHLAGHFAFVEERLRLEGLERRRAIDLALSGKIVRNASTELGSTPAGGFNWRTALTPDGEGYRLRAESTSPPARCTPRCWRATRRVRR